jgi:hypothetical protein
MHVTFNGERGCTPVDDIKRFELTGMGNYLLQVFDDPEDCENEDINDVSNDRQFDANHQMGPGNMDQCLVWDSWTHVSGSPELTDA